MNSLREFSLIAIIIASCLIFTQVSNATPYAWNQTPISVNWEVIPISSGMTLSDIDRDGSADAVYTLTGSTMTKKFGTTGVASFAIHVGSSTQGVIYVKENRILTHNNNGTCGAVTARQYNLLTGTQLNQILGGADAGAPGTIVGLINKNNKTALGCARVTVGVLSVNDSPNVNGSGAANPANGGPYTIGFTGGAFNRVYTYENTLYTNSSTAARIMVKTSTNTLADTLAFTIPANVHVDNNIKLFTTGLKYPQRYYMTETLLSSRLYLIDPSDTMSLLVNLPPRVLHNSFTTPPVYLKLVNSTATYFGALLGTNLYVTNYNTLYNDVNNNRGFANYRIDPTQGFRTTLITSAIPTTTETLYFYNGTSASYSAPPQNLLTSSYHFTTPTSLRNFYPEYTNNFILLPVAEAGGPQTQLTVIINHAPVDSAIMFGNQSQYNSTQTFVHSVTFLQADKSTTINLPTNICDNVYVKDTSDTTSSWLNLGIICNNGVTPKTLSYVTNLPLSFFSFVWGAAHNYTSTNNNLQTDVRHSTTPYTYNVIVKHANGTVKINQTFTTSNEPDVRNFNVSSVVKPASLYIKADSAQGSQIYSAFLGSPVSLASVAAFFHTYFSYGGFDLVSFIPIIFAAMFTRNTVGLGAVLTVVCIATISWLSIIVIPDVYIYIMAVVSIIGMIGYRLAFPN